MGDIVAGFADFGLGLTVAGAPLSAEYAGDYIFALLPGKQHAPRGRRPAAKLEQRGGRPAGYSPQKTERVTGIEPALSAWEADTDHGP